MGLLSALNRKLREYAPLVTLAVAVASIVAATYAAAAFHSGLTHSSRHDTYRYLEQLLADHYPAIVDYDRNAPSANEAVLVAELRGFAFDAYTCVGVGACDREVVRRFICIDPKLSGALSFSSGIASQVSNLGPLLARIEQDAAASRADVEELRERFRPHLETLYVLGRIYGIDPARQGPDFFVDECERYEGR